MGTPKDRVGTVAWTEVPRKKAAMDGEVSRLVDCMVETLQSYVPAIGLEHCRRQESVEGTLKKW